MVNIFTSEVRTLWEKHMTSEMKGRIADVFPDSNDTLGVAKRKAIDRYLRKCHLANYFEGPDGRDRIMRITSDKAELYRSAMAECMVATFILDSGNSILSFSPPGRDLRKLDFVMTNGEVNIFIEVKAPADEKPKGIWIGNETPRLIKAIKESGKQFSNNSINLLAIVPDLRRPVTKNDLVAATIGKNSLIFDYNFKTGQFENHRPSFFPTGVFVRKGKKNGGPAHTRISAVLCLQEYLCTKESYEFQLAAAIVHNPFAAQKMSEEIFIGYPQLVVRQHEMSWIDPGLAD
jgi:hypothetical protein